MLFVLGNRQIFITVQGKFRGSDWLRNRAALDRLTKLREGEARPVQVTSHNGFRDSTKREFEITCGLRLSSTRVKYLLGRQKQ